MNALNQARRWRVLGPLAVVAAAVVAFPAVSGARSVVPASAKLLCGHGACRAASVVTPSVLKQAMARPDNSPPGPGSTYRCTGGSIPAGTYNSLIVAGECTVDAGIVKVTHDVAVRPNAALIAAFGNGPQLAVGGNLTVASNATLVLGCEPEASPCINDPDQSVGTYSSRGTVAGDLIALNAYAVIVHDSTVGHDLSIRGGGGGYNCSTAGFFTVEDVSVGHNATIAGLQTCWGGFFRTTVGGDFLYRNVATADPDGNEIQTNVVQGNATCSGNNPQAQSGDSAGFMNVVFGHANGECGLLTGP